MDLGKNMIPKGGGVKNRSLTTDNSSKYVAMRSFFDNFKTTIELKIRKVFTMLDLENLESVFRIPNYTN